MPATRPDDERDDAEGSGSGAARRRPSARDNAPSAAAGSTGPARPKGKRGPSRTSCAECRRLKLKCDGKVPCNQCVKRGYTAICPDGTQTTGQGHRLFWNTTSELRVKLSEFTERIRQLEDGLRNSHSLVSLDPHPLLTDELLRIKEGGANNRSRQGTHDLSASSSDIFNAEPEEQKPDVGVLDRFGSLNISESGGSKHFGHGANSWWFMHNEEMANGEDGSGTVPLWELLPTEILAQTGSFPLALISPPYGQTPDEHYRMLLEFVPPETDAVQLRDDAFRYAFFMFRPIPAEQYLTGIHMQVYEHGPLLADHVLTGPRLAVFFTLLAIGALVTSSLPRNSPQAEKFHQLGRAALMRSRLVDEPTVEGIQALFLMSLYMSLHDTAVGNTSNVRWTMAGLIMKLTQTMGLQCDPDRFGLAGEEAKRRRQLWGELFVYDIGQAVMFGRPPAIGGTYYDVRPYMDEVITPESDFHTWKYKFASEILGPVHLQAYSAVPPSYGTVINLTRKIEEYPIWDPPATGVGRERERSDYADRLMQRHFSRVTKQEVLLYLHRPFFALATSKHKDDPLKSEYGSSVIAAYRSAHQIISFVHYLYSQVQHPVDRVWFLWANVFGAAVVLGALVMRCPHISFARDAFDQLRVACDLFDRVYAGFNAEKVYEKMIIARDKAQASLSEFLGGRGLGTGPGDDADDLLSQLGAKTRKIARSDSAPATGSGSSANGSTGTHSNRSSPGHSDPVVPLPLAAESAQGVHPRVIEYLHSLPPAVQVQGVDLSQIQPAWNGQSQQHQGQHQGQHHGQGHAPQYGHAQSAYGASPTYAGPSSAAYGPPPAQNQYPPSSYPNPYYGVQTNSGYQVGGLPPVAEHDERSSSYSHPHHPNSENGAYTSYNGTPTGMYPGGAGGPGSSTGYSTYGPSFNAQNPQAPPSQSQTYRPGQQPPGSTEWNQLMSQMYPPQ